MRTRAALSNALANDPADDEPDEADMLTEDDLLNGGTPRAWANNALGEALKKVRASGVRAELFTEKLAEILEQKTREMGQEILVELTPAFLNDLADKIIASVRKDAMDAAMGDVRSMAGLSNQGGKLKTIALDNVKRGLK
jgi:hypothetical protein